jgi:NADPH-dependent glutamate synthase beta subunit-like oxidoreductase
VIGGGNVAIDSARSALRSGSEVSIVYRRSRDEMPAGHEEIEAAETEGVKIQYLVAPTEIITKNGKVKGLRCIRMLLGEPDASGRRRPVRIPGSEFDLDIDTVIAAIGQTPDLSFLGDGQRIEITDSRTLKVDPITFATTRGGVFGGGDASTGPAYAIDAIAAGKQAAISIERYLQGEDLKAGREVAKGKPVDLKDIPIERAYQSRYPMPTLPLEKRVKSFDEVELGLTEEMVVGEGIRCLDCGIPCLHCVQILGCPAIMKDGDKLSIASEMCFGCTVCSQVCPSEAIVEVERR